MERFGLLVNFKAQPEQGERLARVLLQAAEALKATPACELYFVSRAADEPDVVWVSEVWTDREAHQASLQEERVRELIALARPLIADVGQRFELAPIGGKGLPE